jgi:hypothetical protein
LCGGVNVTYETAPAPAIARLPQGMFPRTTPGKGQAKQQGGNQQAGKGDNTRGGAQNTGGWGGGGQKGKAQKWS